MKVIIAGCSGRVGQELVRYILSHQTVLEIAGGTVRESSSDLGIDIAVLSGLATKTDIYASYEIQALLPNVSAVIDFTSPAYSCTISDLCAKTNTIHVCGTTGFSPQQREVLALNSKRCPTLWSSNMSLGITLMLELMNKASAVLSSDIYDCDIIETHHRNKKDVPSGTSLMLAEAISEGSATPLRLYNATEEPMRPDNSIGIAALRAGEGVGSHTASFSGEGETISITHQAFNRKIYAAGAVKACLWLRDRVPGRLYSMRDVLS